MYRTTIYDPKLDYYEEDSFDIICILHRPLRGRGRANSVTPDPSGISVFRDCKNLVNEMPISARRDNYLMHHEMPISARRDNYLIDTLFSIS